MSKTSETTTFPIQCATLDPLCHTPVRLMIVDILKLKPLLGSRSWFMYKTHPINNVDIIGFVTSLKRREDTLECGIDDGTGHIKCFCPLKCPPKLLPPDEKAVSSLSKSLQERLSINSVNTTISLGDFLNVCGQLKIGLWNDTMYVTNTKWVVLDQPNSDDLWLEKLNEQISLYEQVYDEPFLMDENLRKSSKSFVTKQVRETLLKTLKPIIGKYVADPSSVFEFYGYELFDVEEVKKCLATCFSGTPASGSVDYLNDTEKKYISSTCIVNLLHSYVVDGQLIKKSSLRHESVTNFSQLDARYFVTVRCNKVIDAVRQIASDLASKKVAVDSYSVLRRFDVSDFDFMRFSKHGEAIVDRILNLIGDKVD